MAKSKNKSKDKKNNKPIIRIEAGALSIIDKDYKKIVAILKKDLKESGWKKNMDPVIRKFAFCEENNNKDFYGLISNYTGRDEIVIFTKEDVQDYKDEDIKINLIKLIDYYEKKLSEICVDAEEINYE